MPPSCLIRERLHSPANRITMPIREFRDSTGTEWRVWATTPLPGAVYEERLKAGWLTFENAGTRKRLAPIPLGWQDASADRLELLCRVAVPVRRLGGAWPLMGDSGADDSFGGRRPDAPDRD
jgi:hypothetical protein